MTRSQQSVLSSLAVALFLVAGGQGNCVYAIHPYSVFEDFTVNGPGGFVNTTVPANMIWVVESISGRIALPTGVQLLNGEISEQPNPNLPPEFVLYPEPKLLAKNTFGGGAGFPQDIYTFNTATRAYYTGTVTTSIATDALEAPTHVSVSLNGYLIPALTGDYSGNGAVDAADYTVYRDTMGQSGIGLAADGNENNQVDPYDYAVWNSQYGHTLAGSGAGAGANAAVPEPATFVLLILAAAGWCVQSTRLKRDLR
jgi:hypothetical protein